MARRKAEAEIQNDVTVSQDAGQNPQTQTSIVSETVAAEKTETDKSQSEQEKKSQQDLEKEKIDTTPKTDPSDDEKKSQKDLNNGKASEEAKATQIEIPSEVKNVLRRFPLEQELYVDKCGGVYSKDTQQNLIKNAILYKNPFYNK